MARTDGGRRGDLAVDVIRFVRLLRFHGFKAATAETLDACRSLELIDVAEKDLFRAALKVNLVHCPSEAGLFDELFSNFWDLGEEKEYPLSEADSLMAAQSSPEEGAKVSLDVGAGGEGADAGHSEEIPTVSSGCSLQDASLGTKDFGHMTPMEISAVTRLIQRLAPLLATRIGRRRRPSFQGPEIDFRRTLRTNLRYGELMSPRHRKRKITKARLAVLCDVSGSMKAYTTLLLIFIHSLQRYLARGETFVFSTHLTRVTPLLRYPLSTALAEVAAAAQGWSGGTDLGTSFMEFNRNYAGRLLDGRTAVIILSDGWDRGEPALLEREIKAVARRAPRLIWMNPLASNPEFEPVCRGMSQVMPYVDVLLPAHNLQSLLALPRQLQLTGKE